MDRINCDGDENTLSNCSFRGWGVQTCNRYEHAGVQCNSSKYYRGMRPLFEMEQPSSFWVGIRGGHEFLHNSHQRY